MHFIETVFGISPDGGDGSLEFLYLVAGATAIAAVILRRRIGPTLARLGAWRS
jgi:hypothetical protein